MVVWIVVAVVVLIGIVFALFGWDRYRGGREAPVTAATPNRPQSCSPTLTVGARCGCGTTLPRAAGSTALRIPLTPRSRAVLPPPATPPARLERRHAGAAVRATGLTKRFGETVAVERLSFSVAPGASSASSDPTGRARRRRCGCCSDLYAHPRAARRSPTGASRSWTIRRRRWGRCSTATISTPGARDATICACSPVRRERRLARVDEVLELVGLKDAADRRAGGYSLGMRQRLGLAAALLGDPDVLVLDSQRTGWTPRASVGCATSCAHKPMGAARSWSPATCWPRSPRSPMRSWSSTTADR